MDKKQRVLVVDDEAKLLEVVTSFLKADGYEVFTADLGQKALTLFDNCHPDLVILDIMLPDIQGDELCKAIRKKSRVPIIMLTARIDDENQVKCLDLGADDYVTKPFSPRALMGRVRAVMRRVSNDDQIVAGLLSYHEGEMEINSVSREVFLNTAAVPLTPAEYKLLLLFCKNPKKVFTREELIFSIYGYDYDGNDRAIDTHIKNLRQKVEKDTRNPKYVLTVHGIGYKFGGI